MSLDQLSDKLPIRGPSHFYDEPIGRPRKVVAKKPHKPLPKPAKRDWLKVATFTPKPSEHSLGEVMAAICAHFNYTRAEISSDRRGADIMHMRKIFYFLSRKLTTRSYPQIGDYINRDHASVMSGRQSVQDNYDKYALDIGKIMEALG